MHQGPQDLHLMDHLVFVLVHVPPRRNLCVLLLGQVLWQDPPAMTILDYFVQGLLLQEPPQVADVRRSAILDAPQGHIQVRACQGCIPGACVFRVDGRQVLVAIAEPGAGRRASKQAGMQACRQAGQAGWLADRQAGACGCAPGAS